MNESYYYKPRFSFEISEEQKKRADTLLSTYGLRKNIFSIVLDDLLDILEDHGMIAVGALLSRTVKAREVLPSLSFAEKKGKKLNE